MIREIVYRTIVALAILLPTSHKLFAQTSVTATATAEIIVALNAVEGSGLNFGKFTPEEEGGEIRILPDGTRVAEGSVVLSGGLYNPATFYISGQPEYTVAVTLPSNSVLLTNVLNGKTMRVEEWKSDPSIEPGVILNTSGILNLKLGATLKVGDLSENPVGVYSGNYVITFSYN